jgi:hypothetical protein
MGTISDAIAKPVTRAGKAGFLGRIASFVTANETLNYYLYECRLTKRNEADFLPRSSGFNLKIVFSEEQLDNLIAEGFDLSLDAGVTRRGVEKGAIAFLLFVGRELATRELVALSFEAKAAIDKYPYKVDFANGEACASGVWTNHKFRKMGYHTFVFFKVYDYLREHGVRTVRSIVWVENVAAQRAHARFEPEMRKYARGSYFKLMGLHFCRQVALK